MNRPEVLATIESVGLVPVIRVPSAELALRAARAIRDGGVGVVEITMSVPNAPEVLGRLAREIGGEVVLGAGTVLDAETARACIDAGAEFIVGPGIDLPTIETVRALDKVMMPGALTPTEVIAAWRAGADLVKVFPCSAVGGAKYVRALRGPLPAVKLLPTGGVNLDTAAQFIRAGAAALGVGSALVDLDLLERGDDSALAERAQQFLAVVRQARRAATNPTN
jgi:2-dehydro-3-deoxyphosphogluconate aldolase/(4S)-4-hydroxy-2-oxoglutarate aldolase